MPKGKTVTAFVKLAGLIDPSFEKTFNAAKKNMSDLDKKWASASSSMKNLGSGMVNTGKKLTTAITVPVAAAVASGVKSFAEVDKTMQLANKTMGNTAEEANMVNKAMKAAASQSIFTMQDASDAMLNFARAGLDAKESAAALAPAMNLAAGEGGNLDTVSAGLIGTINGFHDSFDQAGRYADVFAAACNNSALDVDSLTDNIGIAVPVFQTAGYAIEDLTTYVGIMANNNIEANVAATSLKTGLLKLAEPTGKASKIMQQLGIEIFNADGSMKDSLTVQKELHDSLSGLSEQEQMAAASAIFGKNQAANWLALINTAPEEVNALSDSIRNASGTTDEMAKTMMSGFGGSIESLKSSLDVLKVTLGELASKYIAPVIQKVTGLVDKFNGMSESSQMVVLKIAAIAAAIGPLMMIGGKLLIFGGKVIETVQLLKGLGLAAKVGKLGGMFGGLGTKVLGLGKFLIGLGPTFWIVAGAIAAVVAIGVLLYKNWDKIKAKAAEVKEWVTAKWTELKNSVTNIFAGIATAVSTKMEQAKAWAVAKVQAMKTMVHNIVTGIKVLFIVIFGIIPSIIRNKLASAAAAARSALENVKAAFKAKLEEIKNWVSQKLEQIRALFSKPITATVNIARNIKETVTGGKTDKKAKGGFTHGLAIAGEDPRFPVEAVLSFNPKYRDENIAYWAKAGRMLGATAADLSNVKAESYGGTLPTSNEPYSAKVGRNLSSSSTQPMSIAAPNVRTRDTVNMGGISFSPTVKIETKSGEKLKPETVLKALRDFEPEFIDFVMDALSKREEGVYAESAALY